MNQILVLIIVVLSLLASAAVLFARAVTYEDYQRAYRSGPLAHWVNNKILVDDNGKTHVPIVNRVCTADELMTPDKKSLLKFCFAVGATVPLNRCNFWWLVGDCIGLYASRDVFENLSLREAIIRAVRNSCIENDFSAIDLGYLCNSSGKLKHKVVLKSVYNNDLEQLEYIIR